MLLLAPILLLNLASLTWGCDAGRDADADADADVDTDTDTDTDTDPQALERPFDPVVLGGDELEPLLGKDPARLAAFRWLDGAWEQVPLQVDQRHTADFRAIYNDSQVGAGNAFLVYSDAGTLAGADPDPLIDADDELVLMARHAGEPAAEQPAPAEVHGAWRAEIELGEPADTGAKGYLYLFEHDGSVDPGAGQQLGRYSFSLDAGAYPDDYGFSHGPNPEDSRYTSPYFQHHFSDRWISDELEITTPGSTGQDILEMHNAQFMPGLCSRSVLSFSRGEGAFVTNISGPVRSIRSYIGANSGPLTQRDHLFYEQREDIVTHLRVHMISGIMDFLDYEASATGMMYSNSLNPDGVPIDGQPDRLEQGLQEWEMVTGPHGSLVIAFNIDTDITMEEIEYKNFYLDEAPAETTQCTGDDSAYGASGLWVLPLLPCTDPSDGCTEHFVATRFLLFEPPGTDAARAAELAAQVRQPLLIEVRSVYSPD